MYERVVEGCIGISVVLFATIEIENYTNLSDRYPLACKISIYLVSLAFFSLHSIYRGPHQPQESPKLQASSIQNDKTPSP
jgi:hypothetical protein